jgi:heat shock protein HslJ
MNTKPMRLTLGSLSCLAAFLTMTACTPLKETVSMPADPAHSSRNSLDWAATYVGTLPCADCPGIQIRLRLNRDESYELSTHNIDRDQAPSQVRGRFSWQANGNAITLDAAGGGRQLLIGEGRAALLQPGAAPTWPQPPQQLLTRVKPLAAAELPRALEDHRWTLVWSSDAKGQTIAGLPTGAMRPLAFNFSASRFSIEGGCNRAMGGYQIDAEGRLNFGRMASTMMACEPGLMEVDKTLAGLLAQPLKSEVLVTGTATTLRLTGAANTTLFFTGQMTPEARYGQPTRVFIEVNAQRSACAKPPAGASDCLQVRERRFDEQGLVIGTPGAWAPFTEVIVGYTHKPGVRNVLRLKRFDRAAVGGGAPYLYMLDMVVESETVRP